MEQLLSGSGQIWSLNFSLDNYFKKNILVSESVINGHPISRRETFKKLF